MVTQTAPYTLDVYDIPGDDTGSGGGADTHHLTVRAVYEKRKDLLDLYGVDVTLDENNVQGSPAVFEVDEGSHTVRVDEGPVQVGKADYVFSYWEDLGSGGAVPTRTVEVSVDTALEAVFEEQ
jgi:hypothetical protein